MRAGSVLPPPAYRQPHHPVPQLVMVLWVNATTQGLDLDLHLVAGNAGDQQGLQLSMVLRGEQVVTEGTS